MTSLTCFLARTYISYCFHNVFNLCLSHLPPLQQIVNLQNYLPCSDFRIQHTFFSLVYIPIIPSHLQIMHTVSSLIYIHVSLNNVSLNKVSLNNVRSFIYIHVPLSNYAVLHGWRRSTYKGYVDRLISNPAPPLLPNTRFHLQHYLPSIYTWYTMNIQTPDEYIIAIQTVHALLFCFT